MRIRFKFVVLLLVLGYFFTGWSSSAKASLGVLYKERNALFLIEKIGRPENLADNPACLPDIHGNAADQFLDLHLSNRKPFDPVFNKTIQDDAIGCSSQWVLAVGAGLSLNLGGTFLQRLQGDDNLSTIDASQIGDADKSFNRDVNAGAGFRFSHQFAAGYAFSRQSGDNYVDSFSQGADSTNPADAPKGTSFYNQSTRLRHQAGIVAGPVDVVAGFGQDERLGSNQQTQEMDFSLTSLWMQARCLLGNPESENLLARVYVENTSLLQRSFEQAREAYLLDLPNNRLSAGVYYTAPLSPNTLTWALAVEADLEARNRFDLTSYNWVAYQNLDLQIPAMLSARLLSWFSVWSEVDLKYQQAGYYNSRSAFAENIWGLTVEVAPLQIHVYTLPWAQSVTSDKVDSNQALNIGMDVEITF
jgi:hypothetical protein